MKIYRPVGLVGAALVSVAFASSSPAKSLVESINPLIGASTSVEFGEG